MSKKQSPKKLSSAQRQQLFKTLQTRFEKNMHRHKGLAWAEVLAKLEVAPEEKLWSLNEMEVTGGEPDIILMTKNKTNEYIFFDCADESPKERRSLCYDREALDARKEAKPADSAVDNANAIGIELLNEEQYRQLQTVGAFDTKTSSWLKTPNDIRELGGAIFGDRRYNTVFIYHNGAQSYYAARGFRGLLRL
jgi:hypothetical protein